jgi:glycosyltransferase involved in cell wall biosynthesis
LTNETDADKPSPSAEPGRGRRARTVWFVYQYGLAAHEPGVTRHAILARCMRPHGWDSVFFSSSSHYWNLPGQNRRTNGVERLPEATFVRIRTSGVATNGVRRILSNVTFSLRSILRSMRRRSIGVPKPDVVVGPSPPLFGPLAAYVIARAYRVPFVLEVGDLWPDTVIDLLGMKESHPFIRILRMIEVFLYKRASAIIGVLPGVEDHVRSLVPDAGPVTWIPNGVDVSAMPTVQPPVNRDGFVVLYAGAHGVPNALDSMLEAAKIVQRHEEALPRSTRTTFVLVGDGKEKDNLVATAARLGLDNLEFQAAVPSSQIPALLSSADILAITWLDRPLYLNGISPNKLFDYFAAGRPVVMALSSPHDPVSAAGAGITVPAENPQAFAQAVLDLRDMSRDDRIRLGLNGRRFVEEQHDMADLAARFVSVLNSVTRIDGADSLRRKQNG